MNLLDLMDLLKKNGKPDAYVVALYRDNGEPEAYFKDIEVVLGLEKGTLSDGRKTKSKSPIADKKDSGEL